MTLVELLGKVSPAIVQESLRCECCLILNSFILHLDNVLSKQVFCVFRGLSTMGLKGRLSGDIGELSELRSLSVSFRMNTRHEHLFFFLT